MVLALAAFLYLWWLAALIFDLVFTWRRYIRYSRALENLRGLYAKEYSRRLVYRAQFNEG